MANITIKAEHVVDAAELSLSREIVLPALTWTELTRDNFVGAKDDSVTLRLPGVATATIRALRSTADVVFNELIETPVTVTLSKDVSVDLKASLVEQTLDLIPFSQRFVVPAIKALSLGVEDVIGTTLDAANPRSVVTWDGTAAGVKLALIGANKAFNTGNVPRAGRSVLVGAEAEAQVIDYASSINSSIVNAGLVDTALLEATVARLFGFRIVASNAVAEDAFYAMSPYAIAFIGFGPDIPAGAVDGASGVANGIGYSIIQDYDPTKRSDRLSVQTYVGATSVEIGGVNPFLLRIGDFS